MAIQENGIIFNNVSRVGIGSPFNNVVNGDIQNESDLKDYIEAGEEYKNIQSVLIDWNDAQLGNKVDSATLMPGEEIIIQTTGQLLSYMSTIAQTTEN